MKTTKSVQKATKPLKDELLKDGKFVKNLYGDIKFPMYQYFDSFYVILSDDKISKVRNIGYGGYDDGKTNNKSK